MQGASDSDNIELLVEAICELHEAKELFEMKSHSRLDSTKCSYGLGLCHFQLAHIQQTFAEQLGSEDLQSECEEAKVDKRSIEKCFSGHPTTSMQLANVNYEEALQLFQECNHLLGMTLC